MSGRRRRRMVALVVAVAALGAFGRFAYLRITRHPTPISDREWLDSIEISIPIRSGAMSSEEASRILTNAPWTRYPALVPGTNSRIGELLTGEWSNSHAEFAAAEACFRSQAFVDARAEVLKLAESGWQPHLQTGLPTQLDQAFDWAVWLAVHSRWARIQGDAAASEAELMAIMHFHDDPQNYLAPFSSIFMGGCCWLASEEAALASLEQGPSILSRSFATNALRIADRAITYDRLVEMIRQWTHRDFDHVYVADGWCDISAMIAYHQRGSTAPVSRLWNLASPLFHDRGEAERRLILELHAAQACTSIADVNMHFSELQGASRGLSILDGCRWSGFKLFPHVLDTKVHIEGYLTMVALRCFRDQHGHYPDELGELVPEFMPRLPVDYADGKPLRYRREEDAYVLYGIGENLSDDGGRLGVTYQSSSSIDGSLDIVFSELRR